MPLWTTEQDDELRSLYARELSCSQIAARMAGDFSRNAVIGRVHRLKLVPRGHHGNGRPLNPNREKKPRRSTRNYASIKIVNNGGTIINARMSQQEVTLRCVEIVPLNLTLAELDVATQCHYIPGDDLLYCGHPVMVGKEYCVPHFHLMRGPGTAGERAATKVSNRILAVA